MENKNIKHTGMAATEHAQEINEKVQYEINKNIATNPVLPMGDRAQGAVDAVGNKVNEKAHEAKKAYHQNQAGLTSDVVTGTGKQGSPVDSNIKHAGMAAAEHAKEIDQKQQFELNKNIAMNPNLPVGDRAQGAVGAVGNLMSEKAHEVNKSYHQTQVGATEVKTVSTPSTQAPKVDIKQAAIAAQEHSYEMDEKARFEAHKNAVMNPNLPVGERAEAAVEAVGNLMSGKAHEINKAYHQTLSGLAPEVKSADGQREQKPTVYHAGLAAQEHSLEMEQRTQYELNKNIALNANLPVGERAQAAVGAVGNLVSEKAHEVNKSYHQTQAGVTEVKTGQGQHELTKTTSEKVKHAAIAATEHSLEIDQKHQYELNTKVAMNEDLPIVERTQAAVGAAGNKISELTHEVSKKIHQTLAGVESDVKTATAPNTTGLTYNSEAQNQPVPKRDIKQAGWAAQEHALEIDQKIQYKENKRVAMNPDLPITDRAQAAVEAVGNKLNEKQHEASKVYFQTLSGLGTEDQAPVPKAEDSINFNKIKHAGLAATEHSQEISQKAELEANKNLALNPELPIGERAQAALGAVGNKISAINHESNKAYHQSLAGVAPDVVTSDLPVASQIQEQKSTKLEKIKHVGLAATEHSLEVDQKQQYEANKSVVLDSNLPLGERTQAAIGALGSAISEKYHESNKLYHQNLAGLKSETDQEEKTSPSGRIVHAGLAANEHALEIDQKEQFELHKNIASNPDNTVVDRTTAALEAVGNKISEKAHEATKVVHQKLTELVE